MWEILLAKREGCITDCHWRMKKEPKTLSFDEFVDELLEEHQPRAIVILASAHIDMQLRNAIEDFFHPLPGDLSKKEAERYELFDGDTPLSTFSSRIKIALRLGLIDTSLTRLLNEVREIRNKAAHWITFGVMEPPLRDQLKLLYGNTIQRESYSLVVKKYFDGKSLNEFERLQALLLTICVLIETVKLSAKSANLGGTHTPLKLN